MTTVSQFGTLAAALMTLLVVCAWVPWAVRLDWYEAHYNPANRPRWYMGLAWYERDTREMVLVIVPFNWVVGGLRKLHFKVQWAIRCPPRWLTDLLPPAASKYRAICHCGRLVWFFDGREGRYGP